MGDTATSEFQGTRASGGFALVLDDPGGVVKTCLLPTVRDRLVSDRAVAIVLEVEKDLQGLRCCGQGDRLIRTESVEGGILKLEANSPRSLRWRQSLQLSPTDPLFYTILLEGLAFIQSKAWYDLAGVIQDFNLDPTIPGVGVKVESPLKTIDEPK